MAPIRLPREKPRDDVEDGFPSNGEHGELEESDSDTESESGEEEKPSNSPLPGKTSAQKQPQTPKTFSYPQYSSSNESRSKPGFATPAAKSTVASAGKRQAETQKKSNRPSKRATRKARGVEEDTAKTAGGDANKKQLFQKLWSDDDEIAILKGTIEYTSKKGVKPGADMNGFLEFIKKSLHMDVTKTQLYEKVRRLRKKYENHVGKWKEGEDPAFSEPHEKKVFELSKMIWGNNGGNGLGNESSKVEGSVMKTKNQRATSVASQKEGEKIEDEKMETEIELDQNAEVFRSIGFYASIGGLSLNEEILQYGLELISDSNKLELEGKWKKLRVEELELYLKKMELILEQTKLVLELKQSRD